MLRKIAIALWVVCPLVLVSSIGCGSDEAVELNSGELPADEAADEAAQVEEEMNDPETHGAGEGGGGGAPVGCDPEEVAEF